jgi:hypothetical protein
MSIKCWPKFEPKFMPKSYTNVYILSSLWTKPTNGQLGEYEATCGSSIGEYLDAPFWMHNGRMLPHFIA